MKRIGTIILTIFILIGIFIVPINAVVLPAPSYFAGVENNLLNMNYAYSNSNFTYSYNSSSGFLSLSILGNNTYCFFGFNSEDHQLSLPAGTYEFGFIVDSVSPFDFSIRISLDGSTGTINTLSRREFTLNSPAVATVFIDVSASQNVAATTVSLRPYLIYKNNSIDSITGAFSSVIQAPFTAIASGFNSLSDQIIGIDNLITPFGTVLVFIVSIPLIVWGLNTLIGFITRPFKRR